LYSKLNQRFYVSDLGFCGPANKPLKSTYGNLPYIAPEVIIGKQTTKASDVYSISILMCEISSGMRPFIGYEHNYDLAMNIVNGIRPKNGLGTPSEYQDLMKQCWNADPLKRPDIFTILKKIDEINLSYQNTNELEINYDFEITITSDLETKETSSLLSTSKIHQFENLPEPKNATEGIYYFT
jgi:serine/threonine protein kinase